jgi:predicted small lipoprotein YifL
MSVNPSRALLLTMALALAACGHDAPPPPPPAHNVFEPITDKKKELPAAVNAAQDQHMEATRKALDEAEGAAPPAEGTPR